MNQSLQVTWRSFFKYFWGRLLVVLFILLPLVSSRGTSHHLFLSALAVVGAAVIVVNLFWVAISIEIIEDRITVASLLTRRCVPLGDAVVVDRRDKVWQLLFPDGRDMSVVKALFPPADWEAISDALETPEKRNPSTDNHG